MIVNDLRGPYARPQQTWRTTDWLPDSPAHSLSHILLIALIPAICCYFASLYIGWTTSHGEVLVLSGEGALTLAASLYLVEVCGILLLAHGARALARLFGTRFNYGSALDFACHITIPLFLVGFTALHPSLWFVAGAAIAALAYTARLTLDAVPRYLPLPASQHGFYAAALICCGLVLLTVLVASLLLAWRWGILTTLIH